MDGEIAESEGLSPDRRTSQSRKEGALAWWQSPQDECEGRQLKTEVTETRGTNLVARVVLGKCI